MGVAIQTLAGLCQFRLDGNSAPVTYSVIICKNKKRY